MRLRVKPARVMHAHRLLQRPEFFPDHTKMKPSSGRSLCHRFEAKTPPESVPNGRSKSRPAARLLFSAIPQNAIKLTRKPSIFSRNDPYPPRSKSLLTTPFDFLPNASNLYAKFPPNPCLFIGDFRPISSQSPAMLGPQASPHRIGPPPGHPWPSHRRKRRPRAV